MPRLANGRDVHLTPEEIAQELLKQFDGGSQLPSMRELAKGLGVSPMAIYNYFPGQAAIVRAAVNLVFKEAEHLFSQALPDPFGDGVPATEILVQMGLATRRAFGRHFRIAPYMAATPDPSGWLAGTLALITRVFERLELNPEEAARAFHTFVSFVFGSVIVAADRRITDEQLGDGAARGAGYGASKLLSRTESKKLLAALAPIIDVSITDPERDETLFAEGLRRLVSTFAPAESRSGL